MSTAPTPPNPPEAVPLPCPFCGDMPTMDAGHATDRTGGIDKGRVGYAYLNCPCGVQRGAIEPTYDGARAAVLALWNRRSGEIVKLLAGERVESAPQPAPSGGEAILSDADLNCLAGLCSGQEDRFYHSDKKSSIHYHDLRIRLEAMKLTRKLIAAGCTPAPTPSPDAVERSGLAAELRAFRDHAMHTEQFQVADLMDRALAAMPPKADESKPCTAPGSDGYHEWRIAVGPPRARVCQRCGHRVELG